MGVLDIHWPTFLLAAVHDLSVAVYVGGAVAMEFILGPAQKMIPPAQAQIMGQKSADRFLVLVWVSLLLILVSGLLRMYYNGVFSGPPVLSYSYGRTLSGLLAIWLVLAVNGGLITFVFRPRLSGKLGAGTTTSQADQDRGAKMQAATWIEYLTRADLVLAIVAVGLGASLLRGGLL